MYRPRVPGILLACALLVTVAGCATARTSQSPSTSLAMAHSATSTSLTSPSSTAPSSTQTTTLTVSPAKQILAGMTLRQKAAQVLLVAFEGTTAAPDTLPFIQDEPPGGVLLLGRNVESAAQVSALVEALQSEARARAPGVPGLLVAVDQEGGDVARIREGVPPVPAARTLGGSSTPEEAARLATETAGGLRALGITVNLAPVADVVSDPDSFLYARSFSDDPGQVSSYVAAITGAYERAGVLSVVKHFPGHGSATGDTHTGTAVSELALEELETVHLAPFRAAIAAGARGIMVGHVIVRALDAGRPASLSETVIRGTLRQSLGFDGLIIADDLAMAAAAGTPAGSDGSADLTTAPAVMALIAGCDMLILTSTQIEQQRTLADIVEAVEAGILSEATLDEAVMHILDAKASLGLMAP